MSTKNLPQFRSVCTACFTAAAVVALSTAASAGDFTFTPIDEIPEGQGLITDQSGEFTIFKWSRDRRRGDDKKYNDTQPAPAQAITSTSGITEAATPE